MKIVWSPQAIDDLGSVRAFIAQDNPAAARQMVLRILDRVENHLAPNPAIGRPGRVAGTREYIIAGTAFVIPYRVHDSTLQVLRVYHAARRWPDRL